MLITGRWLKSFVSRAARTGVVAMAAFIVAFAPSATLRADGPKDNVPQEVRRIPPPGIEVSEADREELQAGLKELEAKIAALPRTLKGKPALLALLPDVQVFHKAVSYALEYNEFFKPGEIQVAKKQLKLGLERAQDLADGKAPWTTASGLQARGYLSKIDGSVQPYVLLTPDEFEPAGAVPYRLDAWFHGRGETLSEVVFLDGAQARNYVLPPHAVVLFLYGRYCNASKFAGEVDFLEALEEVRRQYPIDENRLVVRGFSMGGASCWQMATHFAGRWAAAAPGAGFSETADFLHVFQDEKLRPTWYEQQLWHWYDSTDYALNLSNCPTVAYSGEIDKQKQAADMMAKALAAEGMELNHLIGPKTAHAYHPDVKREVDRRINSIVSLGRNPAPRRVRFTTWTLRYNKMLWVTVDGLEEHWSRAKVEAELVGDHQLHAKTAGVTAITFDFAPGRCPLDATRRPTVILDGQSFEVSPPQTDRSFVVHFQRTDKTWNEIPAIDASVLAKRAGLQGPIDDAFMDSFLMVRPTGEALNAKVGAWVKAEQEHALVHWRQQFRGDARVKDDKDVTDADIAAHNLILWGDPQSNSMLARVLGQLPVTWTNESLEMGSQKFAASNHVPVLIFPNPLNPARYVVLNSSFTYREYDYLNNARQVSKLPDWAIFDISQPITSQAPGKAVAADFFSERWEVRPAVTR